MRRWRLRCMSSAGCGTRHSTVTASNGSYGFDMLMASTYHVREVLPAGFIQTANVNADLTLVSGQNATGVALGNFKLGTISGTKFEDVTGNGFSADDPVLSSANPDFVPVTMQLLKGSTVVATFGGIAVSRNGCSFDFPPELAGQIVPDLALSHVRRVDDRLMLLFWQLGRRWGRVSPEGVIIPFNLQHQLLATLIGAQRPSVTTRLGVLRDEGLLVRRADGTWLLPNGTTANVLGDIDLADPDLAVA